MDNGPEYLMNHWWLMDLLFCTLVGWLLGYTREDMSSCTSSLSKLFIKLYILKGSVFIKKRSMKDKLFFVRIHGLVLNGYTDLLLFSPNFILVNICSS